MLTSEEQTRIIEDERIRQEVQSQIKKTETRSVWKLLNEPFSLWLLSTIVVGLFTFAYAQLNAHIKAREDRRTRLEKLDVQAASRVEFAVERRKQATDLAQYGDLLRTLLQDTDETRMFPEFRDRSTLSIVWEEAQLRKIIGNPTPHDQEAQNAIAQLELESVKLDRSDLTKMSEKDKQTLRAEIDREIDALDRL